MAKYHVAEHGESHCADLHRVRIWQMGDGDVPVSPAAAFTRHRRESCPLKTKSTQTVRNKRLWPCALGKPQLDSGGALGRFP